MAETGKVALITGAASGLGRHLAQTLHDAGAVIIIADISENIGRALVDELNKSRGRSAFFHATDITQWDSQVALFNYAVQSVGRIDYVFAIAGILGTAWLPPPSESEKSGGTFFRPSIDVLDVNVTGTVYTSSLAIQVFRRQERVDGIRGKLILTASAFGIYAAPSTLYTASKYAVVGIVRSLAVQHFVEGITVNGVAPWAVRTPIMPKEYWDGWEAKGWLTPTEAITNAFISYLGTNKDNGLIKEVNADLVTVRLAPDPPNQLTADMLRYSVGLDPSSD